MTEEPVEQRPTCAVNGTRLQYDSGDISESYSADRIASGQPVRRPFQHDGLLWICTSITGSGLTVSGNTEHEAYRLIPEHMFSGAPTTYAARTGTFEAAETARTDPEGFYHGVTVRHGRETFVLCGPPLRFVAEEVATLRNRSEPAGSIAIGPLLNCFAIQLIANSILPKGVPSFLLVVIQRQPISWRSQAFPARRRSSDPGVSRALGEPNDHPE